MLPQRDVVHAQGCFDRFADVIRAQLDRAVTTGEIAPVDTDVAALVWLGAINEVVVHWLYQGGPSPVERYPAIRRLLAGGLAPERRAG